MFFLKLVRLLIYSNLFIAACAVGLQWFCWPSMSITTSVFLFFNVLLVYSTLKLSGLKNHTHYREDTAIGWLQHNLSLQIGITLAALTGSFLCWVLLGFPFYSSWSIALVLLLLYALFRKVHVLSQLPQLFQACMKIIMVAAVWTIMLLPTYMKEEPVCLVMYVFVFVLALMIPFEIRDMPHDAPFHVPTLPLLLGEQKAKQISYLLLLFSLLLYLSSASGGIQKCAVTLTTLVGLVMVRKSSPSSSAFFFLVGVDGLLLFPLLISLFLNELILFYHTFF